MVLLTSVDLIQQLACKVIDQMVIVVEDTLMIIILKCFSLLISSVACWQACILTGGSLISMCFNYGVFCCIAALAQDTLKT